jgi:predicted nucleic acid-binding protein
MPVLETDFLLGLRKEDKKHQTSMKILELAKARKIKKLSACGSAFVELGVGLRGSLKKPDIVEALRLIRALTTPIPEIPLSSLILMNGLELEQRLAISNLFDCLHAATALDHDAVIVSDDHFYEQVPNLRRLSLEYFVDEYS